MSSTLASQTLVDKMIENLPKNGHMVNRVKGVFQMVFLKEGKEFKQYTFDFKTKGGKIYEGSPVSGEGANCVLYVEDEDFVKICRGEMDSAEAFMSKRMRATGNLMLLQKLQGTLKTIQARQAEKSKL